MADLEIECRVYCRYLTGHEPNQYLRRKYAAYHETTGNRFQPRDRFEKVLLTVSRWGTFGARMADSYASRFRQNSLLRNKLVLMLALLECSPPFYVYLDEPGAGGPLTAVAQIGLGGLRYVFALALGALLFGPLHVVFAFGGGQRVAEK